jgi:RNA polymerase sigma-70 factor, ECF subfamily
MPACAESRTQSLIEAPTMAQRDDNLLLEAIATRRDRNAFEELCRRHSRRAYNVAFHFLKNAALAEDAVQEAMLALWLSADSYHDKGQPEAWLMSIVVKKSLHLARTRKHSARNEKREAMSQGNAEDASMRLENEEITAALKMELANLPESDSRLLACCYGAGMTHRKIAEELGMSQSTVTEKIQQALARLRGKLAQAGVAAALPVAMDDQLLEAMTAGYDCPPGIVEGILGRVGHAGTAAKTLSRRAAAAKGGAFPLPAVFAFIVGAGLLAAGVALYASPASAPVKSKTPVVTPAAETVEVPPFNKSWSFLEGPPADLRAAYGRWVWVPGNQPKSGHMLVKEGGVGVLAPVRVPRRPFMVTANARLAAGSGLTRADACWCSERGIPAFRHWTILGSITVKAEFKVQIVFNRGYGITLFDNGLGTIRRFQTEWPTDQICFTFRNAKVSSIAVRELTEAEAADPAYDGARLVEELLRTPDKIEVQNREEVMWNAIP